MFEKAARLKIRFNYRGQISVEDLWDLPLKALDGIFKSLNSRMKEQKEESLLDTKTNEDKILDLKINIVKHIVSVRLQEKENREARAEKAAKKEKILGIMAEKQDEELRSKSVDDLAKLINEL